MALLARCFGNSSIGIEELLQKGDTGKLAEVLESDPNISPDEYLLKICDTKIAKGVNEQTRCNFAEEILNIYNAHGKKPIFKAADNGQHQLLETLATHTKHAADLDVVSSLGETVIIAVVRWAAGKKWSGLNVEVAALESIEMLVAKNCNLHVVDNVDPGFTAIHLAAKNELWKLVKYLLSKKVNIDMKIGGETTRELIEKRNQKSLIGDNYKGYEETGDDPRRKLVDTLMNSDLPVDSKEKSFQRWLLNKDLEQDTMVNKPYKGGKTLLEIAVLNNLPEMTRVLLEKGADPNRALISALDAGETFFFLLTKSSTQLDMSPENSIDEELRDLRQTVLHRAVMSEHPSVKVVKYLLQESDKNKCTAQLIDARDYLGMTALHYAANRNLNDVVEVLLDSNANLFVKDEFNQPAFFDLEPEVVEEHLTKRITPTTSKRFTECSIQFDFDVFLNHRCLRHQQEIGNACCIEMEPLCNCEEEPEENGDTISGDYCEMEPLKMLAESSIHDRLLLHPLIRAFLQLKWKRVFWIYWLNLILCSIHAALCFLYVSNVFLKNSDSNDLAQDNSRIECNVVSQYTIKLPTLVSTFLLFAREVWQLMSFGTKYCLKLVNWLEMIAIAVTIYLLLYPNGIYFRTLASTLLLSIAMEIVLLMSRHPQLATYIYMFFQVSKNFMKLLLWYLCLIIAFSFAFYIIFPHCKEGKNDCKDFFNTIPSSIFKTIVMVTGEFETGDLGFEHVSGIGHLIYIAFLFFISMIMVNLLNGLAVSDTQEIKSNAELIFCKSQVKFFADIESSLMLKLPFLRPWLSKIILVKRFLSTANHTNTIIIYIRKDLPVVSKKRSPFEVKDWSSYKNIVSDAQKILNKNEEDSKLDTLLARMKILENMIEGKNNI